MKWHSWLIVGVLTGMLLAVDVVAAWGWAGYAGGGWQYLFALVIGTCVAQINLISIWAALAPGRVLLRLPWSIFLATLMWYALIIGDRTRYWWDDFLSQFMWVNSTLSLGDAIELGVIILIGVVVVQIPLWAMSRLFGWQLSPSAIAGDEARSEQHQFHLKHLIAGTLLASVTLGLGRIILPSEQSGNWQFDSELAIVLPAVLLVNLVVVVPCIWLAFVKPRKLLALLPVWLFWAVAATIMQIVALTIIFGNAPDEDIWIVFSLFNIAQGLCVFASLLVLRAAGFRLTRRAKREKSPLATMTAKPPLDIMQPEPSTIPPATLPAEHPP